MTSEVFCQGLGPDVPCPRCSDSSTGSLSPVHCPDQRMLFDSARILADFWVCVAERLMGRAEEREQWRREADDVRRVADEIEAVPIDEDASRYVHRCLEWESAGKVEWSGSRGGWVRKSNRVRRNRRDRSAASHPRLTFDEQLSRYERVRQVAPDRWVARCPGHEDRSPSLSIRLTSDRVLVHCHAGCRTEVVLGAIGATFEDLFLEAP